MNGPLEVFRTKQIVQHDFSVELPQCMYKLKNIHAARNGMVDGLADHVSSANKKLDISDQVKQFLKNNSKLPGMAELQLRQEQILQQLAELKKQMLSIKSDLKINTPNANVKTTANYSTATACTKPVKNLPDIVINANPTSPPYALELAQKLLQDSYHVCVTSYLHSTIADLPKNAQLLADKLVNFKPSAKVPKMTVRLIWKDIEAKVELLVSHVPIFGEVNLLRYLARLSSNRLSYEADFETDSLLDVCYLIVEAKNKTQRVKLIQTLNKSLGKKQFLAGRNQVGIADVAAYSAIKQVATDSEANVNLNKWLQRCESVV